MRLVILSKGTRVAEYFCTDEAVLLGSGHECPVRLDDPRIGQKHAIIQPSADGAWRIRPFEAGADLSLNGAPVLEDIELKHGDRIGILDYTVLTYDEASERTAATGFSAGMSVDQMTRFVRFQLPSGSQIKKLEEPVTLPAAQLERLVALSVELARCETVEAVMEVTLKTLMSAFAPFRIWVGVRRVNYGAMEYVEGRLATGHTSDLPELGENLKPRVLDRSQFVLIPYVGIEAPYSVLAGPLAGPDGTLGMVYLDTAEVPRRFEAADTEFLYALLSLIGGTLDAIFKQMARARAATKDGEVIVAHSIQSRLTPRKLPQWDELQFGAFREPGRERSSDFYDVVRLSNQTAGVLISQTSATGPLPSMLIAQTQAAYRMSAMHMAAPHVFLRSMNFLLYDGTTDRPMDCFAAMIDPASGEMKYSLAGRIGAYIIGNRGEERRLGPAEPAPQLAVTKNAAYALLTDRLEPVETLVLYTTGVVSARNNKGESFGEDRFVNILCDGFGQLASAMLKDMLTDLRNFTEGGSQPDDITVILAHRV